ncbi:hypothetical protein LPJ61_001922 [Coemansia biformis]|uniref:PWI domain-containing protein n=1 Tax=Coemansia biformis TaxID=1286918 RepID=A0A9W8CWW1_9FUNG|nr:hypothetical protein LPJ61_001922 [Coemansia biformis]
MSSYEPPPLDAAPLDFDTIKSGRRGRGGRRHSGKGAPLLNPFGSPDVPDFAGNPPIADHPAQRPPHGRSVVAFISGIDTRVGDEWVAKILRACGDVGGWNRVRDADGTPQRFGFCEFADMESAACALRVLSSSDGLREGGWTLPAPGPGSNPQPLQINVDSGARGALDAHNSAPERSPAAVSSAEASALESVERILRELELAAEGQKGQADGAGEPAATRRASSAGEPHADSNANDSTDARRRRRSGSGAAEGGAGAGQSADNAPFSVDAEEAYERERAQGHRRKSRLLAADERERKIARGQKERDERIGWNAARELDSIEEKQRLRDAASEMLAKWDDLQEERLCEHEYYRSRQRWWRSRKAVRAREMETDEADRRQQERDEQPSNGGDAQRPASPSAGAGGGTGHDAMVKALIQEIPTEPEALFAWPVKWEHLDTALVQSKIEPAVRKRLLEYLGGDDEDGSVGELTEYVTGHIRDHKPPQELVEELEMVLVDEAPVFVARVWRVVVYESEAQARSTA